MFRPIHAGNSRVFAQSVTAAPLPSNGPSTPSALQVQRMAQQLPGAGKGGLGNAAGPMTGTPRLEAPAKDQPINTIYIKSYEEDTPLAEAMSALREIGKRRGFNVETKSGATTDIWAEDNSIVFRDQVGKSSLLVSSVKGDEFIRAKSDLDSFAARFSNLKGAGSRQGNSKLPDDDIDVEALRGPSIESKHFGNLGLGRAFNENRSLEVGKAAKATGWDVRSTPLGIEGGNLLSMRNRAGEPMALVGRNTLLTNWRLLANTKQLDPAAVNQALTTKSFDASLASEFKQISKEAGKGLDDAQANRMAAEVEVTKGAIAKALNLDKKNVVVIEQAGFHIDMETRPIGNNKVMVSDLNASVQVLTQSIGELRATAPSAAKSKAAIDAEIKQLEALRTRTQDSIAEGDQHLLDRKAKTLRSAGIDVVRAATNFGDIASTYSPLDKGRRGPINVNFANGIAATDKRGTPYMITNLSASDTLNKQFTASMKQHGIEVEWTPTGTLLDRLGGIDCITLHAKRQAEPQRHS